MRKPKLNRLLAIVFVIAALPTWAQSDFYVSPTGKSSGNGSLKKPFGELATAVAKAQAATGDVTIYLREGTYRLDAPIVITPHEGGDDYSLTIKSYPHEKVVISGSIPLDLKWQSHGDGIMKAAVIGSPVMDMLIVDGEIRHMARFPNYDANAVRFRGTSAEATAPERIKSWANPAGGYLHAMHNHDWGDFHYRITGVKEDGTLDLEGGWQNNRQSGLHKENRMVENIFEELDAPGEWFYAAEEQMLYYYPMTGEDVASVVFESPQLKHLFELRGTMDNPVKNISIEGVELTQTRRTFMEEYEPLLRSDWTVYRGAALFFEGTENCAVRQCELHNLGGNAIFFSNYTRHAEVSGSHLTNIGASAICFVGNVNSVRSPSLEYGKYVDYDQLDLAKGPKDNNYPAECLVFDNLIHSIGLYEKQITGVEISMAQGITVSHNSIYDVPRAGVNVSEGTWGGHIFEFNDIFDTVKETGDHGSFNSWGRDRFWHPHRRKMNEIAEKNPALILADAERTTIIRNNRFRCDRGWDIDLDDGSSNYQIYNNLCLNGGIKLREGFYRVVENNIMVNNSFHPHVWFKNSGDVFARNIVMTAYRPIQVNDWGLMVDYNIFTDSLSYAASRKRNTDEHSIVADIRFANPETGDFSVSDDSEAITKGGFRNFEMDKFGVLSPRLKALAKTPQMPMPVFINSGDKDELTSWSGVVIKNLQTLGERSATGMDSERGVYVVSINTMGGKLRDYLRPNDVILKVAGSKADNLKEMREALQHADKSGDVEFIIFRTQAETKITIPGKLLD
ncbi:MAG: hypothetical protein ACK5LR_03915 [Mangrovibacterium sp.]